MTTRRQRWWRCTGPACSDVLWRHSDHRACWMCGASDHVESTYPPLITSGPVVDALV